MFILTHLLFIQPQKNCQSRKHYETILWEQEIQTHETDRQYETILLRGGYRWTDWSERKPGKRKIWQASGRISTHLSDWGSYQKRTLRQNLTQDELGERIGVQKAQISRMERGYSISIPTMSRVFKALGINTATLDLGACGKVALWWFQFTRWAWKMTLSFLNTNLAIF